MNRMYRNVLPFKELAPPRLARIRSTPCMWTSQDAQSFEIRCIVTNGQRHVLAAVWTWTESYIHYGTQRRLRSKPALRFWHSLGYADGGERRRVRRDLREMEMGQSTSLMRVALALRRRKAFDMVILTVASCSEEPIRSARPADLEWTRRTDCAF